jgi:hypothetical protein
MGFKNIILNYMKIRDISLLKFFGEDNIKKCYLFLEKQNLTKEEKLILDDFRKNEKEAY